MILTIFRGVHIPTKLERLQAETETSFGGADLASLNVKVRNALRAASTKHEVR
jgi:hypothetical protein